MMYLLWEMEYDVWGFEIGLIIVLRTGSTCRSAQQKCLCGRLVVAELVAFPNAPLHLIDDCLLACIHSHSLTF